MDTPKVYKCELCGKIVEVLHDGGGTLVCCNQDMTPINENDTDAAQEKHVPVIEKIDGGVKVVVGSVIHPMGEKHLIEWIELVADGIVYRKNLTATSAPEAVFMIEAQNYVARAYCNLHGLWIA